MPEAANSPARILAPFAVIVCAIAFFAVILSSDAGDDDDSNGSAPARQAGERRTATGREVTRPQRRVYTVKTGDTLGGIAVRSGIDVERLQELNPELDPQALVAGQKIKLRE